MRARKCDRCGKLYESYAGSKDFKTNGNANGLLTIDRDMDNKYWSRKTYDLCPECMKKLQTFLKGTDLSEYLMEHEFTISFPPDMIRGTMQIGDKSMDVYCGELQGLPIGCPGYSPKMKHRFNIIEL